MHPGLRTLVSLLAAAAAACGSGELATPSTAAAERLVRADFPEAEITVREVERAEDTLRIPAEFNGADVTFVLTPAETDWEIAWVQQGSNSYTVEQLHEIAATMQTMSTLSDALEAYRETNGNYPLLDDQIGLRELLPDYYPGAEGDTLVDAWGTPLRYRVQGADYTMTSTGPDGDLGSPDDIILITGSFVSSG